MLGKLQITVSFDLDDTLNWMSLELAREAGLKKIPKFDDIKAGKAPASFYEARARLFPDVNFWANQPKTQHADAMIQAARDAGLKPIICTKTPMKEGFNEIASAKVLWAQQNVPGVDMLIATGCKHSDSNALIDDSVRNCYFFNQYAEWFRPVLVWDNSRPNFDALEACLRMARHHDIDHKYNSSVDAALVVVKAKDTGNIAVIKRMDDDQSGLPCGLLEDGEDALQAGARELYEETSIGVVDGLTFKGTLKDRGQVVHCFYAEVECEADHDLHPADGFEQECIAKWMDPKMFIVLGTERFQDFNTVLLYNLCLI